MVKGDGSKDLNLQPWSGMPFVSEHASFSSYERPLEEDSLSTKVPCVVSASGSVVSERFWF